MFDLPKKVFWRFFILNENTHSFSTSLFRITSVIGRLGYCDKGYDFCKVAVKNDSKK